MAKRSSSPQQCPPSETAELLTCGTSQTALVAAASASAAKAQGHMSASVTISTATAVAAGGSSSSSSHDPVLAEAAVRALAEHGAARAAAFAHVVTLSDDEDFFVVDGGVTDSDPDTEELLGRVDWQMAQNSEDYDVPSGYVQ